LDQVELDLVLKNGILSFCEIKSSMSKADIYAFHRKVKFYEKIHNRTASRLFVISPMVDPAARQAAQELGITIYSYADEVEIDSGSD